MKKIGFVDYYISEWHANNYPAWIKKVTEQTGMCYEVAYFWAEQDVSPVDGVSSKEWAAKMGITQLGTIEELCEKSDAIIVLAPSNPEKHLGYAQKVLQYKKPTYIDKTFAPDLETAEKIFDIAKRYGTPFFSTSALRYADELEKFSDVQNLVITGGGTDFEEYIIHNCELAVAILKDRTNMVKVEKLGTQYFCRAKTQKDKEIGIIFSLGMGYSITAEKSNREFLHEDITSDFFLKLIAEILKFFHSETPPFNPEETIEVMRMREALIKAAEFDGQWLRL